MNKMISVFQIVLMIVGLLVFQGCDKARKADVKKVKIDDAEIAYYTRGSGDPLIMIMGFRGTMGVWDPGLLEILEKKYQLILFDNRGAGFSTGSASPPLTIAQMADDTAKLIQSLGFQKAHVLGWSMGTRIAMELTFKHPELVETLILCSPNPGGKYQVQRKSDAYATLTGPNLSKEEALSLIFPDNPEGHKASAAFVTRLTKAVLMGSVPDDLEVSKEAVEQQVHALQGWDKNDNAYAALSKINTPTLVAGGLADVLDDPENARTVASQIPFAWSAYFPGAGHDFLSQDYENFAELVTIFIETNKRNKDH